MIKLLSSSLIIAAGITLAIVAGVSLLAGFLWVMAGYLGPVGLAIGIVFLAVFGCVVLAKMDLV